MSLESAIETVYKAFSDVEKPLIVDGCPCCMTPEEYETLTAKPLRALTSAELSDYASDVMLTMGSPDDYRYFLPRILELTIEDDPACLPTAEIAAKKIRMAGFKEWDEKKQASINNLWLAVIRETATSDTDPELLGFRSWDIGTWLGAATLIPIRVSPLLDALEGEPDIIRTIYNQNFKTLFQGRLDNAFLEEPNKGQAEITSWLRSRVEKTME
ncbi:MAG TPA: hypothetical protein VGO43_01525 [Pyrinomonadaceae bacterium]|jgi:hypothetical protein|nr:hypothetical protein [Pyrinomonadaceae bacterium]